MIKKTKKCCLLTVGALGLAAVVAAAVILKKKTLYLMNGVNQENKR